MKLAFAAALIAAAQAVDVESWGGAAGPAVAGRVGGAYGKQGSYAKVSYTPVTKVVQPAAGLDKASKAAASTYQTTKTSDWDAWGRDQDLAIDESYGKTSAKSYTAESYDEWDNADDDKWGAQAWGKDRDLSGASSYERDASTGMAKGKKLATDRADWEGGAAMSGYDNDEWAKQAYGSDYDSRWGKSYDSVAARSYDNEHYAREVRADDDQWAEDYDTTWAGKADAYGNAASAHAQQGKGWGGQTTKKAASAGAGREYWGGDVSDWDAYGRDQDFHEKVSYDTTMAKSYSAESYDEWDNTDADKWGAQAWGKDNDVQGASSYGRNASSQKDTATKYGYAGAYGAGSKQGYGGKQAYGAAGGAAYGGKSSGWGKGGAYGGSAAYGAKGAQGYAGSQGAYGAQHGYAKGAETTHWSGASAGNRAAKAAMDNDSFAKQAYGSDSDTRWGKSYDSVSARSYQNEKYARWLQADDDQWAEDYDAYENDDSGAYGKAASYWGPGQKGWGKGGAGALDAASQAGQTGYWGKTGSDWDAYGRDQDLEVDESYEATWAKSYDAESYDEWDNADADKWGAQAWGKDRDIFGASSIGLRASERDLDKGSYAYGAGYGSYGAAGKAGYGAAGYGAKGGAGGWGGASYGAGAGAYGAKGGKAYGGYQGASSSKTSSLRDGGASAARAASAMGYDNDEWAKQAYGRDMDTRWGKSYDFVDANSYDDEQYARKVRADDDQWAEDYDRRTNMDVDTYGAAASTEARQPQITKTTYKPQVQYGSYGSYGGYGAGYAGGYGGIAAKGKGGYAW